MIHRRKGAAAVHGLSFVVSCFVPLWRWIYKIVGKSPVPAPSIGSSSWLAGVSPPPALQQLVRLLAALLYAAHLITRKSELERILLAGPYTPSMQRAFASSLSQSRQLHTLRNIVFGREEFDVQGMTADIIQQKRMSTASALFRSR